MLRLQGLARDWWSSSDPSKPSLNHEGRGDEGECAPCRVAVCSKQPVVTVDALLRFLIVWQSFQSELAFGSGTMELSFPPCRHAYL